MLPYFYMKFKSNGHAKLESPLLAQSLIKLSCERAHRQFIVIDGLDECERNERSTLLSLLAEIVEGLENLEPGKLRLLIVSQLETDIGASLTKSSQMLAHFSFRSFTIFEKDNKKEIDRYVEKMASEIELQHSLSPEQAGCIKRLTSSRAEGLYPSASAGRPLKSRRHVSVRTSCLGQYAPPSRSGRRDSRA